MRLRTVWVVWPLLALLFVVLSGCNGELPEGDVRISTAPTPPVVGPTRIVVEAREEDGNPVEGGRAVLRGVGPAAETEVELEETGQGRYIVPDFPLEQSGTWTLTAVLDLPDGRTWERSTEVRVLSGGL